MNFTGRFSDSSCLKCSLCKELKGHRMVKVGGGGGKRGERGEGGREGGREGGGGENYLLISASVDVALTLTVFVMLPYKISLTVISDSSPSSYC